MGANEADVISVALSSSIDASWTLGALRLRVVLEFTDERGTTVAPLVMPDEAGKVANVLQTLTDCFRAAQLAERAVGNEKQGIVLLPVPGDSWQAPEGKEH